MAGVGVAPTGGREGAAASLGQPAVPAATPGQTLRALLPTRREFAGRALTLGATERRAILMAGDLVALLGTLVLVAWFLPKPTWLLALTTPDRMVTPESVVVLVAMWVLAAVVTECYDLTLARSPYYGPLRAAGVVFLVHVGFALVPLVSPPMLKSSLVWSILTLASVVAAAAWRFLYSVVASHPVLTLRALILGAGESGQLIANTLRNYPGSGHRAVAFVSQRPEAVGGEVAGLPVVGSLADLPDLLSTRAVDELIVATEGPMLADGYRAITLAYESGIRVIPMATLYERVASHTPVQHVGDHWLAVMPQPGEGSALQASVKRCMDIAGGLVGLLILLALAAPLALAIKLDSPGPVLFSQERVGRGGRRFRIYKFRSLPDRPAAAAGHAAGGPERAEGASETIWQRKVTRPTRVGRWLRRTRLDELPQFWNILVGDMSLVGPRPYVEDDVAELQRFIPFFRCRLLVRPGLTGWAQVKANYGTTPEDELVKLQYDLYYIRHQSLAFDVAILIKTFAVMLRLAGR